MPVRAGAFGPTAGTPRVRRPSMLSRLASGDGGSEDTRSALATPERRRLPRAQEQFQPLFPDALEPERPEQGVGPSDAGAFAGDTPSASTAFQTMPLLSPSQEQRQGLLSRLAANRQERLEEMEPSDAQEALAGAKTGVKAVGGTAKLLKLQERDEALLSRILGDAGFPLDSIQNLIFEMDKLNLPDLAGGLGGDLAESGIGAVDQATGSTLERLAGDAGAAAGEGAASEGVSQLATGLGQYAQYLPYIAAALGIGTIAAGDLQDDQKVIASLGTIAALGVQLGTSAAIGGTAGLAATSIAASAGIAAGTVASGIAVAAMVSGLAAPVAMGIAFAVEHFMDQMQDIPHDVREQKDVARRGSEVQDYATGLDEATTLERLMEWMQGNSAPAVGGGSGPHAGMAFVARHGDKFIGKPNATYPTATLEELLANPEQVTIFPQLGVDPSYTDPWKAKLTNLVRNRLAMFARAKQGDPSALASLELLTGRVKKTQAGRAETLRKKRVDDEETARQAALEYGSPGET